MPLLPSALPPKGEASHYGANNFLNLIALPWRGVAPKAPDRVPRRGTTLRSRQRPICVNRFSAIPKQPTGVRFHRFNMFYGFSGFSGEGAAHFVILSGEKRRVLGNGLS